MKLEGLLDVVGASAGAGKVRALGGQQAAQQNEVADGLEQYEDFTMVAFLKRYKSSVFTEPNSPAPAGVTPQRILELTLSITALAQRVQLLHSRG
jgi:hypothetical protein